MKIAILRKKYTFHGGAEGFSQSLITQLADLGHEIHIYAIKWKGTPPQHNIFFHRVPAITFNSFLRDLFFAIATYLIFKKEKFDIIQSHDKTLYQDIYRAGDGCHIEWLRQRWKKTGIAGKISIAFNPYHLLILALEHSIFKGHRYKKILAISKMVKRNIVDNYGVSPDDINVIYNGVDLKKFHPDNRKRFRNEIRRMYGLNDNDFVILFVGSGFERKGVRYLIQAVESIAEPVSVLIVGKGKHPSLSPLSKGNYPPVSPLAKGGIKGGSYQHAHNIIFCGPQKEIYKYYAASDIFVFPTIYEPFGNVHLEALASGLPVITTKYSGAAEIIKDNVNGFVIQEPGDLMEIAERIKVLLNRDKLESMGENARRLAENFTFDKHIGRMMALYERVMSGRATPPLYKGRLEG